MEVVCVPLLCACHLILSDLPSLVMSWPSCPVCPVLCSVLLRHHDGHRGIDRQQQVQYLHPRPLIPSPLDLCALPALTLPTPEFHVPFSLFLQRKPDGYPEPLIPHYCHLGCDGLLGVCARVALRGRPP